MHHPSPEELLDLAEATAEPSSNTAAAPLPAHLAVHLGAHLKECPECRDRVAELRALVATIVEVDVPEPSPLFWDHLSARVREGVAAEAARPAASWWGGWLPWRLTAAASVVAVVVAVSFTTGDKTIKSTAADPGSAAAEATLPESVPSLDDDPSFGLIADLSSDVDWDAAVESGAESGMIQSVSITDSALTGLTDDERLELRRLLREAMGTSGG